MSQSPTAILSISNRRNSGETGNRFPQSKNGVNMNNVTATIEFMYTDDFPATINTSDKKALKQFFEQSCAKIAKDMKNNSIKEC